LVPPARQARQAQQARKVRKVRPARKASKARKATKVQPARKASKGNKASKGKPGRKVRKANLGKSKKPLSTESPTSDLTALGKPSLFLKPMSLNLYSSTTTDTLLAAKVDLAGGTMTGALTLSASGIIFSDATFLTTAPAGSTLAADQLTAGVVTANPTAGPTASGDVLQYNGSALIWGPGGSGGGLTISTLSNGATSTLNATVPTAGQVLSYDGTDLIWSTGGGGGSVAWGSITGTVTDQTDLTSYISSLGYIGEAPIDGTPYVRKNGAWDPNTSPVGTVDWSGITGNVTDSTSLMIYLPVNYYPLTGNPSGFLTSVPAPSLYDVSSSLPYTLALSDANNIVYIYNQSYQTVYIPTDMTVNFPIGTTIRLVLNNCGNITVSPADYGMSGPAINNSTSNTVTLLSMTTGAYVANLVKVAADSWVVV
jgi:hypothetical protein